MSLTSIVSNIRDIVNLSKETYASGKSKIADISGATKVPNSKQSVVSSAGNAMMDFPLLISTSVSPNGGRVVAKVLELLYASFVESAIALQSAIDIDKGENIRTLINRIHNNISSLESPSWVESCIIESVSSTNEDTSIDEFIPNFRFYNEASGRGGGRGSGNNPPPPQIPKDRKEGNVSSKSYYKAPDISKAIEAIQPLSFVGKVTAYSGTGGHIVQVDFNYSVRIVPHIIERDDVVETLKDVIVTKSGKFKFLQVLTGEKNLIKDLLLGVDDAKRDYVNKPNSSGWWGTLRRLARLNKNADGYIKESKIPTGSLLISQSDIDQLIYTVGKKHVDDKMLGMICNHFTLLGIFIIDESVGSLKMFLADKDVSEVYSIDNLINLTKKSIAVNQSGLPFIR